MWWGLISENKSGSFHSGRASGQQAYYIKGGDVCVPSNDFTIYWWPFGPKVTEIGLINLSPPPILVEIEEGIYGSDGLQWIVTVEVQLEAIDDIQSLARIPIVRDTVEKNIQLILRNFLAQSFKKMDHKAAQDYTNEDPKNIVAIVGSLVEENTPYRLLSISITQVRPADQTALDIVAKRRLATISEAARAASHQGKIRSKADEAVIEAIDVKAAQDRSKADQTHREEIEKMQTAHEEAIMKQKALLLESQRIADLQFEVQKIVLTAIAQSQAAMTTGAGDLSLQKGIDQQNYAKLLKASRLPKKLQSVLALGVDGALNLEKIGAEIIIAKQKNDTVLLGKLVENSLHGGFAGGTAYGVFEMLKQKRLLPDNFSVTFDTKQVADGRSTELRDVSPKDSSDDESV